MADSSPVSRQPADASSEQRDLLAEIEAIIERFRHSPLGEPLQWEDVFAPDLMLTQLFVEARNARRTKSDATGSPGLLHRARAWLSRGKRRWRDASYADRATLVAQTDVLLWPRETTHVAVLKYVSRALQRRGVAYRTLSCQGKNFLDCLRNNMSPAFAPAAWPEVIRAAESDGRRRRQLLESRWKQLGPDPAIDPLLEQCVYRTIHHNLVLASIAIANAHTAFDRFHPRVVVVGNDNTLEGRAACHVARRRGIPSVAFMHGNITGSILHARHCVDRFLVHGETHRQDLINRGLSSEQVVVTGSPHLDGRPQQSHQLHPRLEQALGLADRPWVLVATSGPGNLVSQQHHEQVLEGLARLVATYPTLTLAIKLHRKDRVENYQQFLKQCGSDRVFIAAHGDSRVPGDIFDWLQGCKLMLTGASAVAVEAMLLNVPVVTMDFCNEFAEVDFIQAGATNHVRSHDELVAAVGKLLSGDPPADVQENARRYVAGAFYRVDGKSADRGAEVICQLGGIEYSSGQPRETTPDGAVS